jgi:hypothetical protein
MKRQNDNEQIMGHVSAPQDLIGKTIATAESYRDYSSLYGHLLLLTFTDDTKGMIGVSGYGGHWIDKAAGLDLAQAEKCPAYFLPDDLAEITRQKALRRNAAEQSERERDERELKRLQSKLGSAPLPEAER